MSGCLSDSIFKRCIMRLPLLVLCLTLVSVARNAGADVLTPEEIAVARKIYETKCAKCHAFYEPTNYVEIDWRKWMVKMSKKSKLKPEADKLLNRYLDEYRAQKRKP